MIDHATLARLAAVRSRFAHQMPAHVAQMRSEWAALMDGHEGDDAARQHLIHSVQRLIESAATFGYDNLGVAARRLEAALRQVERDAGERDAIDRLISDLWTAS